MFVRNLNREEFPVQTTITNDSELNGNRSLSSLIKANKVNNLFIDNLTEMWEIVDHDDVAHKIIYAKKKGEGKRLTVDIKAIPLFFDVLDSNRIYEEYNEHMTAQQAFGLIFADTGFDFVLVDPFLAVQWEGFGKGESKLESFKRALNRYKAEFRLLGNMVYLESRIGSDTNFMYRYRLNASNIVQEIDASQLWTHAKGFGNYEEGDEKNAKLKREYTSPLAQIPGIGIRHAPPIYDGRITDAATMDQALKELVDESLKISVSADIHDLTKQGYPIAQAQLGDRVFLIDERIGLNEEVRVVSRSVTRNWRGEIIDIKQTFGSEGLTKRHQSKMQTAANRINELMAGRIKLPYNALDNAILRATEALKSAQTELKFENGIVAIDKNNPNLLVLFNSAGLGVSKDGGNTFPEAITGLGINTNLLTAGQIKTNNIEIVGRDGLFYWDGNHLIAMDPNDINKFVRIKSGEIYIAKGASIIERPDGYKVIDNGILNHEFNIQGAMPEFRSPYVTTEARFLVTSKATEEDCQYYSFRHDSRFLKITVGMYAGHSLHGSRMTIVDVGDGIILAQKVTYDTSPTSNLAVYGETLTIDLGPPTGQPKGFYVRLNSGIDGSKAYGRVISIWKEG